MRNIKKIFSFMLVFVLAFSVFSIRVNGENSYLIISEDYENVYLDSENYIKIDGVQLEENYPTTIEAELKPLESQNDLKTIEIKSNTKKTVLKITFSFLNGDIKTSYYIHYLHENEYKFAFKQPYSLNFNYSDESLSITKEDIDEAISLGEKVVINKNGLYADEFHKIVSQRGEFTVIIGFIILDEDGNFYYTDLEISKKHSPSEINNNYSREIPAIKLSDSEFLLTIKGYYNDSLLEGEAFDKITSIIFLTFFLLLIPLITLIISIVARIKSKKAIYKKMWTIVLILSVAEIILFFISAFIILK